MSKRYQPPYTITPTIIRLISDISEQLGRLAVLEDEKNCACVVSIAFAPFKVHLRLKATG